MVRNDKGVIHYFSLVGIILVAMAIIYLYHSLPSRPEASSPNAPELHYRQDYQPMPHDLFSDVKAASVRQAMTMVDSVIDSQIRILNEKRNVIKAVLAELDKQDRQDLINQLTQNISAQYSDLGRLAEIDASSWQNLLNDPSRNRQVKDFLRSIIDHEYGLIELLKDVEREGYGEIKH